MLKVGWKNKSQENKHIMIPHMKIKMAELKNMFSEKHIWIEKEESHVESIIQGRSYLVGEGRASGRGFGGPGLACRELRSPYKGVCFLFVEVHKLLPILFVLRARLLYGD